MNRSTPGLPVHHQLPQFTQTHVHWVDDAIPAISSSVVPFSSRLQSFPASRSFPMSQFFASGGQSIRASASASVLPMNTQDWFPLWWTSWISLLSKGLTILEDKGPRSRCQQVGFRGLCPRFAESHPSVSCAVSPSSAPHVCLCVVCALIASY